MRRDNQFVNIQGGKKIVSDLPGAPINVKLISFDSSVPCEAKPL